MNAESYEVLALDKNANTIEESIALKEHTATNRAKQYLNKYGVRYAQIWKSDTLGNATLFGVYTTYLGKVYKLVEC